MILQILGPGASNNKQTGSELEGVQAWYGEADKGEQVQMIRIPVVMNEWADLVLMAEWMVWVTPWQSENGKIFC